MMDKIVVTAADIEKLLAWRDEHNDLVRSMLVPLREVEIQIVESGISIKCFRSDKKLKLYLDSPARKLGHVVFAPLGNGLWKKKVSTLPADCNPTETEQGALTVYGSLMALMTYGTGSIRGGVAATTSKAPAERTMTESPSYAARTVNISRTTERHLCSPMERTSRRGGATDGFGMMRSTGCRRTVSAHTGKEGMEVMAMRKIEDTEEQNEH